MLTTATDVEVLEAVRFHARGTFYLGLYENAKGETIRLLSAEDGQVTFIDATGRQRSATEPQWLAWGYSPHLIAFDGHYLRDRIAELRLPWPSDPHFACLHAYEKHTGYKTPSSWDTPVDGPQSERHLPLEALPAVLRDLAGIVGAEHFEALVKVAGAVVRVQE